MTSPLGAALAAALGDALASPVRAARPLGGGDINEAYQVELDDGRAVFVKTHRRAPVAMFAAEARGLRWLAAAHALGTPRVLAVSPADGDGPRFLALELLRPAPRAPDFDEALGRGLAALHAAGASGFGLDHDNFIGSLPQDNTPAHDWAGFYGARRLAPQLRRAVDAGLLVGGLARDLAAVIDRLPALVGPPEPPARLHGDLWGGNLQVDAAGAPCLIDPAAYAGHREVDLAMMALFGGFGSRVTAAYDELFPRAPGWQERTPLYQLYPLLVHVNLFGAGYLGRVRDAVDAVS